jgi:arylsulfatase A-like enzyme
MVPRALVALRAPVLLVCGIALADAVVSRPRGQNVLLITIDTLRADHMGLYGYARPTTPRIDAWFREGRLFERAYSTEANTSPSIASVLTGLLPQEHGVRLLHQLLPERNRLLPDLLPARFQTAAVVSNSVLADEAMGMGRRFDHYDDFVDESEPYRRVFERSAEKTTEAAIRWLQEERVPGQPVFLWVHYIDPHGPYHPPPTWPRSFTHATPLPIDVTRLYAYQREPGVTDGLAYVDAYDEEIAYLDASLGRLLDVWASTMEPSGSLAILTADHGESMMEHERWFTHGYHVYEEIVRVPLLMRGAGVPSGRSRMLASGIDVAPTILRFAGVPVPANLRGEDLRAAPDTPSRPRTVFAGGTWDTFQWRAAVRGDQKTMVRLLRGERTVLERRRYDLTSDPREETPGEWPADDVAGAELVALCESDPDPGGLPLALAQGIVLTAPKVDPRASPAAWERLRSLGYVQ